MNNTNNYTAEIAYAKARQIYFDSFIGTFREKAMNPANKITDPVQATWDWVNSLKMSQSEIRLECGLSANATMFKFGLTEKQNSTSGEQFNTEQRLNMQDTLVANEYGIFVAKTASDTDTEFELKTYGNFVNFTAAAAAALNGTLYTNGSFSIMCNGDLIYPYRGLVNHIYKPQTQQTSALGVGSPADQIRGAEDGYITLAPNLLLIGQKGYQPVINLKSNLSTVDANSRVILIFRGVLAQNSTSVS